LPFIGNTFDDVRLTSAKICNFKELVYLNLVDIADNNENKLVFEDSCSGKKREYPCPKTITNSVVKILRYNNYTNTYNITFLFDTKTFHIGIE
jgi:hypothetical protein